MPPNDLLIPFLIATSAFAFSPGPGMIYMAVQTMAHGTRAGWLSSLAFHLASYLHILLAAFGVTLLLRTAPYALLLLKLAGAAYLIWMGIRMFRRRADELPLPAARRAKSSLQAFKDSLAVEILNPKSALFFVAFVPQFTSAGAEWPVWLQIIVLGAIANAMFNVTDAVCILSAHAVARRAVLSSRMSVWGRRLGGGVLIAMGGKIATESG